MKLYKSFFIIAASVFTFNACINDLDVVPIDDDVVTSATVFNDTAAYKAALAKIYAGLAITGQKGAAGNSDLNVNDEGFTSYLRLFWNATELPTDEAVNSWGDAGLPDFHFQNWSSSNNFLRYLYDRVFYQVSLANEYIRQVTPRVNGLPEPLKSNTYNFLAEARFMRALSYYHAIDLYGNVPFVTENDPVGSFLPKQKSRSEIFDYIESELLSIVDDNNTIHLVDARENEYARADKGAAYALLAKLYLNAEVYTGTAKYTECIASCKKVIASGYSLNPSYAQLFMADNNLRTNEIIFPVTFDGIHTITWGGMTFIISAAIGGNMNPADYGSDQKWGGNRVTSALVNKFGANDKRAMFFTNGQSKEISDIKTFADGYAVTKFTNKKSDGTDGQHKTFVDTDFPLLRLADVYLMYIEAHLRGGTGGSATDALNYFNLIRQRAYGDNTGNISSGQLTLEEVLDERARELFWECSRRNDLIRFGQFSNGTYVWPWKGGVAAGVATSAHLDLYPIPSSDLTANPTLVQNDGY